MEAWGQRPPKPPVAVWRSFTRKLAFVLSFSAVALSIATVAPASHRASVTLSCFDLFVNALKTETATGVWACMDEPMHRGYFGLGWMGDADVQKHYFDPFVKKGQTLDVHTYPGNPVKNCAVNAAGNQVCRNTYLVFFAVINADGTPETACSMSGCGPEQATFVITLDSKGLIGDISGG